MTDAGPTGTPCGPAEAIAAARNGAPADDAALAAALSNAQVGEPALVHRLDRPGATYWLVPFSEAGRLSIVVQVERATCRVVSAGRVTGTDVPFLLDRSQALAAARARLADLQPLPSMRLVWRPGPASWSPFLPLWEIVHGNRTVFVDQSGGLHDDIAPTGSGGGSDGQNPPGEDLPP